MVDVIFFILVFWVDFFIVISQTTQKYIIFANLAVQIHRRMKT